MSAGVAAARSYLVTGGAGFLGASLCRRLLLDGHQVLCVDNLSTGSAFQMAPLRSHPRFTFLQHDVIEPLPPLAVPPKIEGIFHLACAASPRWYQAQPIETTRTAVLGTLNLLELARGRGIPMLQASTSEVYGSPLRHPQREEDWGCVNPIGPRACYDEGKRCAESLCADYRRHHGVDVRIARIFNTYGPGMRPDDGRVVSNFILQALRGEALTIFGDGQQTRSLCFVDDLVEGLMRLLEVPGEMTLPVNLGNPEECSIHSLALLVREISGADVPLRILPLPEDDPPRRCPDISRARELLGWQPQVDLHTGLAWTVDAFRADRLRRA